MRNTAIFTSLFGSLFILCLVLNLFETAFMFVLFGILPGKIQPLSAVEMMNIYGFTTVLALMYVFKSQIVTAMQLLRSVNLRRTSVS